MYVLVPRYVLMYGGNECVIWEYVCLRILLYAGGWEVCVFGWRIKGERTKLLGAEC